MTLKEIVQYRVPNWVTGTAIVVGLIVILFAKGQL